MYNFQKDSNYFRSNIWEYPIWNQNQSHKLWIRIMITVESKTEALNRIIDIIRTQNIKVELYSDSVSVVLIGEFIITERRLLKNHFNFRNWYPEWNKINSDPSTSGLPVWELFTSRLWCYPWVGMAVHGHGGAGRQVVSASNRKCRLIFNKRFEFRKKLNVLAQIDLKQISCDDLL